MNLSDFSSPEFNAFDWINSSVALMGNSEDLDTFLSGLTMKVQVLSQDCSDFIETQMGSLLNRLPDMIEEVVELTGSLDTLKSDIKDVMATTRTMEKNAETEVLSDLKGVQSRMKTCQTQLEAMLEWDQLCASCEDAIRNEETDIAATLLGDMTKSVCLLAGIPDQEKRLNTLQTFRQQLESQLYPKLQTALETRNDSQQLSLHRIYTNMGIESQFIDAFCSYHVVSFIDVWKKAQTDNPTDTLQNFYSSIHTWLISLAEEILSLFGDRDDDVMTALIRKGCDAIKTDLMDILCRIPVSNFRRAVENAFSYMEILVSGLSSESARHTCLLLLLREWNQFIATELAENEYNVLNEMLNGVMLQDETETMVITFTKSLTNIMSSFLLACTSYQAQCRDLGHGVLIPAYMQGMSKLTANVCSKLQVLLDRYNALAKSMRQQPVLSEHSELSSFDWDTFQALLTILLYIDALIQVLRNSNDSVLRFLASNRTLFLDLASGGSVPTDASLPSLNKLLLEMQSQEVEWRNGMLTLLNAADTLPAGVMLSPLQSSYTSLVSLITRVTGQISSRSLSPIEKVFKQMITLPVWNKVDLNSLHSLPSDFITPVGEHLLKIVEQLETVSSAVNDTLAAFRSTSSHVEETNNENSSKTQGEWKSLRSELERYGKQREKSALNKAELQLKGGVCAGLVLDVNAGEETSFSQHFLELTARLVIGAYIESLCSIQHIKISGAEQLSTDVGYLSNIIQAFGLGAASVLILLKELLKLSDSELSQKLSSVMTSGGDEAAIIQKIAKLRGVLACSCV